MGYIAYLERNRRTIQFDGTGLFFFTPGWTPPTINLVPTYAVGTSASAYSPSIKVGERTQSALISVPFHIRGATSDTQVNDGLTRINAFLRDAGKENEPTYFVWLSNNDVPYMPIWGQTVRRMKISEGAAYFGGEYGVANLNQQAVPRCRMDLTVCAIEGLPQELAYARGGVIEFDYGSTDGKSAGLILAEPTTNKMTNPVFGNATWNNGWTAGASIIAQPNYNPDFLIRQLGPVSARLTRSGNVSSLFTQSIAAGNTNAHTLSCFAKKDDGSAVTASDVQMWYNTNITTSYTSIGNGWYRLTASVTGIAGATLTGVSVRTDAYGIYVTGFQFEEKAYRTPLCFGDLLGCSWTSTVHASTSTRGNSELLIQDGANILNPHACTVRVAFTLNNSFATLTDPYIFKVSGINWRLLYRSSDSSWVLGDGTNELTYADTPLVGQRFVIHAVFAEDRLELYKNGASVASGTHTPAAGIVGANFNIGSTGTPGNWSNVTFHSFVTWGNALTDAQVAADYANIYPLINSGLSVSPIPWLWTQDGDGVIDDVTDADQSAYGVISGLDGDIQTDLSIIQHSGSADTAYVGIYATDIFIPQVQMYDTAVVSIDTTPATGINPTITAFSAAYLRDMPVYLFSEIKDAGTNNLEINPILQSTASYFAAATEIASLEEQTIDVPSADFRVYNWTGLRIPNGKDGVTSMQYILDLRRTSGAAANVSTNAVLWFDRMAIVYGQAVTNTGGFLIVGNRAYNVVYTTGAEPSPLIYEGPGMVAVPQKYNHYFAAFADSGDPWYPAAIDQIKYTPKHTNA